MKRLLVVWSVLALFAGLVAVRPDGWRADAAGGLEWKGCGSSFECATFAVPVDYTKPQGATLNLSVIRLPARDQSKRIGVLMVNPGGPGGSAVGFARVWGSYLPKEVRDRFDLVTFDPRGVGESSPILCHNTLQALVAIDPEPDSDAEWADAERVSKQFADDCLKSYGNVLPYVGTKNVARDMDSLRAALGEEKLTYVGYSYGTAIGAVYADLFPNRVRAFVLDGALDLSLGWEETAATQAIGFERALTAYIEDCDAKKCAASPEGNTRKAIDDLLAAVEVAPLPAPGKDRKAGPGEVLLGIVEPLYSRSAWTTLSRAIAAGRAGDGSMLVGLADQYLQREPDGSYPNLIEANNAVNAVDEPCPQDPVAYRAMATRLKARSEHFGPSMASAGLVCAFLKQKGDPLEAPRAKGSAPVLVIGTTNDPATPYEWAVALSSQLENGKLLTYRGNGHTIYLQGESCVDDAVNAYLLNLTTVESGKTCGSGPLPPATSTRATAANATAAVEATQQTRAGSEGGGEAGSGGLMNPLTVLAGVVVLVVIGLGATVVSRRG